jgi:hypothetical protein
MSEFSENTEKPKIEIPQIKMKDVKEIFMDWSQRVDINAFTKMLEYKPNHKVQFIWLLILLGSTGGTFYFISKSIIDYLNYDVVSQTNIVSEIPTQFPAVTFCDANVFSTIYSQSLLEDVAKRNGITKINNNWTKILYLTILQASNASVSDEERKKFGFGINQILKCEFINNNCLNDLHWIWLQEYGNFWQFNFGLNFTNQKITLKQTPNNGKSFGLTVEIFPLYNQNKYITSSSKGMYVFVHNSSFTPRTTLVSLEPGKASNIEIQKTFIQKSSYPYSECIYLDSYSSKLYDYIKSLGQNYRQEVCFRLCLQETIISKCNCFVTLYSNLSTTVEACLTLSHLVCAEMQYYSFDLYDCKTKSCPLECETVNYNLSVTSQAYPSQNYYGGLLNNESNRNLSLKYLNQTLSYNIMKDYSLSFNVYFSENRYTILTESPKTSIADLFSQIGGGLGLFVSFSVFTLFEFIEIFILVIYGLLAKRPLNTVTNQA